MYPHGNRVIAYLQKILFSREPNNFFKKVSPFSYYIKPNYTLHLLKKKINDNWNKNWKYTLKPRPKIVKNDFFKKSIACTLPRYDQVITSRIIIGHTKLTHTSSPHGKTSNLQTM